MPGSWPTTARSWCCGLSSRHGAGGRKERAVPTSARAARSRSERLAERLRERRREIERALRARVWAIGDPTGVGDPAYAPGLKAALDAALGYFLEGIETAEPSQLAVPTALAAQARLAAQRKIGLELVLRRCLAGHAVFCDFLLEEAQEEVRGRELARLLRAQAALLDALVEKVSEEHRDAERLLLERRLDTGEKRKLESVRRLLDGERLDASGLDYELEGVHIGVAASGDDPNEALQALASSLRSQLLVVSPERELTWAWLGAPRRPSSEEIERTLGCLSFEDVAMALGEPAEGLSGWRLTHRQACAALPLAVSDSKQVVRYADVMLLASLLQDDLLRTSLRRLYLEPLEKERDGGEMARATLRAYFACARNVSSAASALGVSRKTVANRLHAIEDRLGRSIEDVDLEIAAALRLEEARAKGHNVGS